MAWPYPTFPTIILNSLLTESFFYSLTIRCVCMLSHTSCKISPYLLIALVICPQTPSHFTRLLLYMCSFSPNLHASLNLSDTHTHTHTRTHTHTHTSSHPWEVLLNILCPYWFFFLLWEFISYTRHITKKLCIILLSSLSTCFQILFNSTSK